MVCVTVPSSAVTSAVLVIPLKAFDSDTTAKMVRITISVPKSATWERAESSIPFQQIQHMAMMNSTPMVVVR